MSLNWFLYLAAESEVMHWVWSIKNPTFGSMCALTCIWVICFHLSYLPNEKNALDFYDIFFYFAVELKKFSFLSTFLSLEWPSIDFFLFCSNGVL